MKLGDPLRTWLYLDPATGTIKQAITRRGRLQRWIFNGLHSLDFSFWYYSRPAWDIGIISLLVGGLVLSVIGTLLAAKRLV